MRRLLVILHEQMEPQDAAKIIRQVAKDLKKGITAGSCNEVDWEAE